MHIANYLNKISEELSIGTGIQIIDEVNEFEKNSLYKEILTPQEQKIFNSFKFKKKREDWFAGRIAAKKAFKQYLNIIGKSYNINISVFNNQDGSPYIYEFPHLELSISHSSQYAISIISKSKVGIDLEKIIQHNLSILKYYFSKKETLIIKKKNYSNDKLNELITMYWTRKEAVAKYLKLGMKLDFKNLDTTSNIFSVSAISNQNIKLKTQRINDYYLSIAT